MDIPTTNLASHDLQSILDQEFTVTSQCNLLLKGQKADKLSRQQVEEKFALSVSRSLRKLYFNSNESVADG